jgi:glycosyltransferase involved in cell wall biosynthesis
MSATDNRIRIVRVIARLNVGGPAIQALTLTKRLEPLGYDTTLVRGREGPREGSMDDLAEALGVRPVLVPWLSRDPGLHDVRALLALVRLLRRERPRIVHTHAAKGGTIGRVAAVLAFPRRAKRPVLIHTFHGHSLTGYFSPRTAALYRTIERVLARRTQRLIAVSDEVRLDLVALGVAEAERFEVIPLGFDLAQFQAAPAKRQQIRASTRASLDIDPHDVVVTLVARLVPIKRVDRFLAAAASVRTDREVQFLIVGDGELRESLERSPPAIHLGARVTWAGFHRDMPAVYFASDVVVLTSDNEGTPVSLIEAAAAGVPAVSTQVGGAASVIVNETTGLLVPSGGEERLAQAITRLVDNSALRAEMGKAAAVHALHRFSLDRLVSDVDALYRRLLDTRATQDS